ncbi:MAG: heavy metal translocating P-type ATPase [Clostridium sp.]|nr:heavy metal translocating P-type ATPase [Clostridium sp.]MCM1443843.1 heavy metal translocating P-type ATPase [Candidatus Amulumruptor caecigallinarius]
MKKVILSIEGMTCSACSNGLEKYLNKQSGITASVNLVMATASIEYEDNIKMKDLEKYIIEAGFKSLGVASLNDDIKKESMAPFFIFGLLAILLMYISMSNMFNFPIPSFLDMKISPINYSICLLILTIPFLYYGFDILKNGLKNLIHKMPNMDTLVGIGVISSFLYSLFGVIMVLLGNEEYLHRFYFESTAFVIYFIKLGRFIDKSSKEKTKSAIKKLVTITPNIAKIKIGDDVKEVTIDEVKKGDILIAFAGDKIAVDGTIVEGESHFDESFITGESKPTVKKKGNKVIAGSINYDGIILYKAEKIGSDSMISEIVNLVVEATNTKAPISLLADKISSYFVPIIMILSILTFVICIIIGIPFNESLTRFVTILVVACPCALGLATPLAIVVSEGICAEKGILIKSSETLEQISKVDTVVFDKTGTLTNANLTISKIFNYENVSNREVLSILGSLENLSTHPIAKGIMNYINNENISYDKNIIIENLPGYGIMGKKGNNKYYACNSKMLDKLKINNSHISDEEMLISDGNSIVYVVKNKRIIGLVGVKNTIRKEAKKAISTLKNMGINTVMLTGDNEISARLVAEKLGIKNIISNVIPKEKSNIIKKLKNDNKIIAMVGDGINDAPSLVNADIGISVSTGTDIAMDSSDVILMNSDLFKIVDLIKISKKTLKNIKQNLFWAFLYNTCMIPIAMGLFNKWNITINPMLASIAMIFSSLFVVFNALRLKINRK